MTVLGKILVFVNLIFSLLTGGLIVMVYSTRTNWASAHAKEKATTAIVRAQMDAEYEANKNTLNDYRGRIAALDREKQEMTALLTKERSDLAAARQENESIKLTHGSSTAVNQAQADELKRRKDEVDRLTALIETEHKRIADIDQQMAKLRSEKVSFQIQFESSKARNEELLKLVQAKDAEIASFKAQLGPGSRPGPVVAQRTPLPENFRGTVSAIQGELATITPGSDAGAAVGAELQVFRLGSRPEYLGRLIIQAVTPHEAVGRLEGPKKAQVKVGDEVAARLQ